MCRRRALCSFPGMRILIVEDDRKVASFLEKALREEGYAVDVSHRGDEGAAMALVNPFDLLLLDVMLPGKTGIQVIQEVRQREMSVPILLLTARDSQADTVRGLDAGADDYLTKPFGLDELLARIRALLRRGGSKRPDVIVYKDIELDRSKHTASHAGLILDLTPREFQLLEFLVLNAERVVRRTELLEKVWDLSFDPMSNVVDVHVAHLRQKLRKGGALLHTVRGVGYQLKADDSR
jgi:DNA-binding response OmpR family regulator